MIRKSFKSIFSLFVLLLAGVLSMSAQQVTKEAALSKANKFFNQSNMVARKAARKAPLFTLANNRNEFYVFNDEANGGYVVISGDERMPDVLGYSYTGHFDVEHIPCNMKAWLEDYARQVEYLRTHPEVPASRRTATEREEVSPLLTCHFNQGPIENKNCPIIDGLQCPTGCTATAMAQIMYYYQWPKQTTETIPAYTTHTTKIDMPAIPVTTIDWDNILNKYNGREVYSDEQIDAISNLMLLCGTSVEMNYTSGSSGAPISSAAQAFRMYFDYDDIVEYVRRRTVKLEDWEKIIYDELNEGRPVLFAGYPETGDGHAFVFDGYQDGYFHVNWGWGGAYDDYFLLTDLNGFNYDQEAVVGIQPNNGDYPNRYAVFDNGKMTLYYDKEMSYRSGIVLPRKEDESNYKEQITECVIDPSFVNLKLKDFSQIFRGWDNMKSIEGIENLNTSMAVDMGFMFADCSSLTSLDLSGFNTDKVIRMCDMFHGCSKLTNLDVSKFKTDNVTDMTDMFRGCSSLTSLDVSGFNTDKVIGMSFMFLGCSNLTSLDVSRFKTDNVTGMRYMFSGCSGLTSLDVSGFNTANVTGMGYMFRGCSSLTSLDVSKFKTDNVTDMSDMFRGCSGLTSLDVSRFKTDNVTNMTDMFRGCSGLTSLDVSGFNTANVTGMGYMFSGCSGLTSLDVSRFKTDNVTNMTDMFRGCSGLKSFDVSGFNTANVTGMGYMFSGCSGLTSLDVSGFKTDNVTEISEMFRDCSSLTSLDVSGFNTTNVTGMGYMFSGCSGLTSLDVSRFKTDNVTDMGYMFNGCSGLSSLDVSGFNTSNVTNMRNLFSGCSGLTSLDVSGFNTSNVTNMRNLFSVCSSLTSLDVSGFNTSNVTSMSSMFSWCTNLTSLDVSRFKTDNVTNMYYMFYGCSGLTSLDLSGFKTDNVTDMGDMFYGCSNLTTIYASERWDMSNVEIAENMFKGCKKLIGGAGTPYDHYHIGGDYARIDGGPDNPGYFSYRAVPTDIRNIYKDKQNVKWYTLDGRQIEKPRKGLYIVRMSNGETKKVMVE